MARSETRTAEMQRDAMEGQLLIAPEDGYDPDTETAFSQWRDSLDNSQAQAMLRVMRVPMDDKNTPQLSIKGQTQLFTVPVDQYDMDGIILKVRQQFMPKPMLITAVRVMGFQKGASGIRFNRILVIEKGEDTDPAKNNGGPSVAELVELINAQSKAADERAERMMGQLLEARTQAIPAKDPMQIAIELMGAMSGFFTKLPGAVPVSTPVVSPLAQLGETIGVLKLLKDFTGQLGGGKEADDDEAGEGIAGIVKSVASAVKPLAEGYAANAQTRREMALRQAPRRLAPPVTAPVAPPVGAGSPTGPANAAPATSGPVLATENPTPPGSAPITTPTGEAEMLNEIGPQLDNVCNMAAQGADPKDAAGLLMDLLPDKFDDALFRLVSSGRFVKSLAVLNPKVKNHEAWFEQFRQAVLAEFDGGSDESEDENATL